MTTTVYPDNAFVNNLPKEKAYDAHQRPLTIVATYINPVNGSTTVFTKTFTYDAYPALAETESQWIPVNYPD